MDVLSCILTNRIPPTKVMMSESGLPRENSDTVLSRVYGVCLRIMMPWTGGRSICGRLSCSRFQRLLQLLTYLSDAVSCAIFSAASIIKSRLLAFQNKRKRRSASCRNYIKSTGTFGNSSLAGCST